MEKMPGKNYLTLHKIATLLLIAKIIILPNSSISRASDSKSI